MSIKPGVFWISNRKHNKYLDTDCNGAARGATLGHQGLALLNSTTPRTHIWLIERATDGDSFRIRNYETSTVLGTEDQNPCNGTPVTTKGNRTSQLWEINRLEGDSGATYQIKHKLGSKVLDQTRDGAIVVWDCHQGNLNQEWSIEPVLLPTLYWITNQATPSLVLDTADLPNAPDGISSGVALAPPRLGVLNQLWALEYISLNECILRNASHNQFVLDISDSQTVRAHEYHGGTDQRWQITDENEDDHSVRLRNMRTGTLLAARTEQLPSGCTTETLVVALGGNIRWRIQPCPQVPLFWVTIQNLATKIFISQASDGSIVPTRGALHADDHSVQWRFIILGNGSRYAILNRATGFVLKHEGCAKPGATSILATNAERNDVSHQWMCEAIGDTNNVGIINVGSSCALDHFMGQSIQAYAPGASNNHRRWVITPCFDSTPSFAIVNLHTGRCITNNPIPNVGTVTTTEVIDDFRSQWLFYHPVSAIESDPDYVLLNKMSGNVLEHYNSTQIEAHESRYTDPRQKWKLLPLRDRLFAIMNTGTQQFLYDPGEYDPLIDELLPDDNRVLCWYLVSHRESGFDFTSMDFDILQRLLPHLPYDPASRLKATITHRLPAGEKKLKGKDKTTHFPHASRLARVTNDTIRAVFVHLADKWVDDSIPEASQPCKIVSANRIDIEGHWGISISDRAVRDRSDEPDWAWIDLQGVYHNRWQPSGSSSRTVARKRNISGPASGRCTSWAEGDSTGNITELG